MTAYVSQRTRKTGHEAPGMPGRVVFTHTIHKGETIATVWKKDRGYILQQKAYFRLNAPTTKVTKAIVAFSPNGIEKYEHEINEYMEKYKDMTVEKTKQIKVSKDPLDLNDPHPQNIYSIMSVMTIPSGKYKGRTFKEVWKIDEKAIYDMVEKKTYGKYLSRALEFFISESRE